MVLLGKVDSMLERTDMLVLARSHLHWNGVNDRPNAHGFEVAGDALGCAIRRAPGYSGKDALAVLLRGVEQRAFPGAAFAVLRKGETVLQGAVGRFT